MPYLMSVATVTLLQFMYEQMSLAAMFDTESLSVVSAEIIKCAEKLQDSCVILALA